MTLAKTIFWFILFKLKELFVFLYHLIRLPYSIVRWFVVKPFTSDKQVILLLLGFFTSFLLLPYGLGLIVEPYVLNLFQRPYMNHYQIMWTVGLSFVLIVLLIGFLPIAIYGFCRGIIIFCTFIGDFILDNWRKASERAKQ